MDNYNNKTSQLSPISVDSIFLVTNECIYITSAMRKNARWAQSSMAAILGVASIADNAESDIASRWGLRGKSSSSGVSLLKDKLKKN